MRGDSISMKKNRPKLSINSLNSISYENIFAELTYSAIKIKNKDMLFKKFLMEFLKLIILLAALIITIFILKNSTDYSMISFF